MHYQGIGTGKLLRDTGYCIVFDGDDYHIGVFWHLLGSLFATTHYHFVMSLLQSL
jgi:hypothetical protein